MMKKRISHCLLAFTLLAALVLPGPAWAGKVDLSPRDLRAGLKGGISALEKDDGRTWLRVAAPKLTTEQAERLKRLNSLGYMGGSSILGADRPLIIAPFSTPEPVSRVTLELNAKAADFTLKVFIATEDEDVLFRREIKAAQLAAAAKAKGVLELNLQTPLQAGDYLLGLDFISGSGKLGQVTIH